MKKITLTLLACAGIAMNTMANNILVSNATLSGQNTSSHYTMVNFNVSWENSWRTTTNENNYDGAWIFVKFRKNGTSDWRHATLNVTGSTASTGSTINVSPDGKGLFIYRNATGIGDVNFTGNQVQWNYGTDGVLDNETVEIRVFAVEMVYVPEGSFYIGSGGSESYGFKKGSTSDPYLVTNDLITWGTTGTNLNSNGLGPVSGNVPSSYPTGYQAFWIMKYEISEQQFADFLNHIDEVRAASNKNVQMSMITGTHPNYVASEPERAMNYFNVAAFIALADWSGMRPMSEFEFEKSCRGYNISPVPNEYVWGNTSLINLTAVTNSGAANEEVSTPANANANIYGGLNFPARVGIFARQTGSTRELSGASYYGIMNLGDNVQEIVISAGTIPGLNADGSVHGDGYIAANGTTDISGWLNVHAYGHRGGSCYAPETFVRTSDRISVASYQNTYGTDVILNFAGGRFVRTAP